MLLILWAHAIGLTAFSALRGYGPGHIIVHGAGIVAFAAAASLCADRRRLAAAFVSLGLITSSALLVHTWDGVIEGHFHFFVMIALLALYEDWLPFLLAAGYVVVHHGLAGAVDPGAVYNHADAKEHPWKWAAIHGVFVVGAGLASVATWRLNEDVRGAMRRSEARLAQAQSVANIGSWDWDLSSGVVTWSDELYRIVGADPAEWTPSYEAFLDRVHPDDKGIVTDAVETSLATRTTFRFEARILRDSGEVRVIDAHGTVSVDGAGEPVRMVGTSQDVTERKAVERELELKSLAEHEHRARSDFLSRVSHELRTPLNAILGFAQLLELDDLNPEQRRSVEQITKGGRHLLELINEVLEISRIEAANMKVSLEPLRLGRVIDEVLELLQPVAARNGVTLTAKIDRDADCYARADNQRLKQVLLNLVSNAIKYNREDGSVTIRIEKCSPERALILVTDTGKGISEDKLAKVFNPFERLDAEQDRIEGTGLGLTLSKLLVEAMDGTLTVESEPWVGTTFMVGLVRSEPPELAMDVAGAHLQTLLASNPRAREATVLYVEDNISNFELVEQVLSLRPGISLLTAINGTLGLDLAREHAPDLILLDLHLPGMPGEQLLKKLKEDPETSQIPVVVVSADATERQLDSLLQAGARAYLTKPIEVRPFLAVVDEALATRVTA